MHANRLHRRFGPIFSFAILLFAAIAVGTIASIIAGCGGAVRRQVADPSDAIIRIDSTISSAVVVINDRELGTVRSLRRGIALSPGTHRLEVRHPRYHSHYSVLVLQAHEHRTIRVTLAERLL